MADVFLSNDTRVLLRNKSILFIGDSNMRAQYKDCLWLYRFNSLIHYQALRRRLENSFLGDSLIQRSQLTKGRNFTEHRVYKESDVEFEFLFVTRCITEEIRRFISDVEAGRKKSPDVVVMNSCLWDITRWGPDGPKDFRRNVQELFGLLKNALPKECLVVWATSPPVASKITGGLIIKQIEFMQETLRFEIMAASKYVRELVNKYGFDLIDFNYFLQFQVFRRSCDGVHYLPGPVRFMTNILLTHICLSWGFPLPANIVNTFLDAARRDCQQSSAENKLTMLEKLAETVTQPATKKDTVPSQPVLIPRRQITTVNSHRRRKRRDRNFKPYNRY